MKQKTSSLILAVVLFAIGAGAQTKATPFPQDPIAQELRAKFEQASAMTEDAMRLGYMWDNCVISFQNKNKLRSGPTKLGKFSKVVDYYTNDESTTIHKFGGQELFSFHGGQLQKEGDSEYIVIKRSSANAIVVESSYRIESDRSSDKFDYENYPASLSRSGYVAYYYAYCVAKD